MYVAVTRARERLYPSFAQSRMLHGQTRYNLRSRFLEEIPSGLTKWLTRPIRARLSGRDGRPWTEGLFQALGQVRAQQVQRAPPPAFATLPGGLRIKAVAHGEVRPGVIVAAEGSGSDAKVQINFGPPASSGCCSVAKLDPV